jgi:hypothetical protein
LGGVADIARLAQDKNSTPWDYVEAGVKAAKNVTENIPILKNIMHIADFAFNGVNEAMEMAKDENTNWVDWTRYGVVKVMDVLTFIPGVGQLISFIGSGIDFFLQDISQLWNINKINNKIRLENANSEAHWNNVRRWNELMKKEQDAVDKYKKDFAEKEKASEERAKACLKKSFNGEVDGHGIETIIWGKGGDMNPEEWAFALRKYSSLVVDGRMAEMNPNDINYFKGQTVIDPNGNKLTLHDAVVENVDGVIYAVQNEGVNIEENINFEKNYVHWAVKDTGLADYEKFQAQYYAEKGMELPEMDQQRVMDNTYIPWDNSKTKK